MAKKVRKRKIKKEKVSRKKKIKEISKEKLKKFEGKLKGKKSEQINKKKGVIQSFQEEDIVNLEEFLRNAGAPVLKRIAIAEETLIPTRTQQARDSVTGNETNRKNLNYSSISRDYADIATPNQGPTVNNPQNIESTDYDTMFEETKETEESRRLLTGGDNSGYRPRERENDPGMGRRTLIKGDREFRKYISKGDVK